MNEEKLYAVKNDKGKYWNFEDQDGFWKLSTVLLAAFTDEKSAKSLADEQGGHVVTLVEEPKKIVLPKEVADELESAKECKDSFDVYIMRIVYDQPSYTNSHAFWMNKGDGVIKTLMDAWDNGYTVEKEKKYNVKVPHTKDGWYYRSWNSDLRSVQGKEICSDFTEADIERYGLQDCEKVEVTDNEQ